MNKLLQETWDLLKENPNLYFPPILLILLSGTVNVGPTWVFGAMLFMLLNIAITSGWLNQIKKALLDKTEKPKFDDVLIGIGKYFGVILMGNIVVFSIIISLFFIYTTVSGALIGQTTENINQVTKIVQEVQDLSPKDIAEYMSKLSPEILDFLYKWIIAIAIYIGIAGLFTFFIGLWAEYCIIYDLKWFESWKRSIKLVSKNLGIYTILSIIEGFSFSILFLFSFIATGNSLTQILLTIVNILVKSYFTILFCIFIIKLDNTHRINLEKDGIQSSISEIRDEKNK